MSIITSSNAIMERGEEKRSSPPISSASSFTINQSTAADLEQHQRNLIVLMDMALRDKRESLFGEHGNKSCREEIKFPVHAHHGGQGGEETNTGEMTSPVRPPRQKPPVVGSVVSVLTLQGRIVPHQAARYKYLIYWSTPTITATTNNNLLIKRRIATAPTGPATMRQPPLRNSWKIQTKGLCYVVPATNPFASHYVQGTTNSRYSTRVNIVL